MKTIGWALVCGFLGAVLGIAIPVATSYALAASDGFKPGGLGSAGTAFALMLPFTALGGTVAGIAIGAYRGRTGKWGLTLPKPNLLCVPDAFSSLEKDHLILFEEQITSLPEDENSESKRHYLEVAVTDYRRYVGDSVLHLAVLFYLLCPVGWIFPLLGMLIFVGVSLRFGWIVFRMRKQLTLASSRWREDIRLDEIDLPRTLKSLAS